MRYTLAQKLHNLRGCLRLREVATNTGLSVSFLSDLERGKGTPSLDTLQKLGEFYGLTVTEVLRFTEYDEDELCVYIGCHEDVGFYCAECDEPICAAHAVLHNPETVYCLECDQALEASQ
jgi:transcriptional regulator with XRE-family HTH domain